MKRLPLFEDFVDQAAAGMFVDNSYPITQYSYLDGSFESADSIAQQQLMAIAYSIKKGDAQLSDYDHDPEFQAVLKKLIDGMTLQQLKDFASTKHDGLPQHVEQKD